MARGSNFPVLYSTNGSSCSAITIKKRVMMTVIGKTMAILEMVTWTRE